MTDKAKAWEKAWEEWAAGRPIDVPAFSRATFKAGWDAALLGLVDPEAPGWDDGGKKRRVDGFCGECGGEIPYDCLGLHGGEGEP